MRLKPLLLTALIAACAVIVSVLLWRQKPVATEQVRREEVPAAAHGTPTPELPKTGQPSVGEKSPGADLQSGFEGIGAETDPQRIKAILDALAAQLRAMPVEEATRAVQSFLGGGSDVTTRLPFAVGAGGNLTTAPTFRVWLLDQLGQINPDAAADYATTILTTPERADEWAVALRDFARVRTAPGDVNFASAKLRELFNQPGWQSEQSVGWLEAFDVAVHLQATDLTPDLARLVTRTEKENKPAAHAAYLTLDRLVQAAPTEMLGRLQAQPDLMKGREQTRANYFARADIRDPQQRQILEQYLLDPRRSSQEIATFAGLYPNANMMISNNLLTTSGTISREDLVARDREALAVATDWLKDPRFANLQEPLRNIHARLTEFVSQAGN